MNVKSVGEDVEHQFITAFQIKPEDWHHQDWRCFINDISLCDRDYILKWIPVLMHRVMIDFEAFDKFCWEILDCLFLDEIVIGGIAPGDTRTYSLRKGDFEFIDDAFFESLSESQQIAVNDWLLYLKTKYSDDWLVEKIEGSEEKFAARIEATKSRLG